MIAVRNLTKTFGHLVAVDSIEFEIPRGEVVGFLGPNGAGKTTTIRMMTGFLPPTAGEIDVDGLLEMLGVNADASLIDISEARLRFLSEQDPSSETNEDAAQIKERIRREVNTAYASIRLTRGV